MANMQVFCDVTLGQVAALLDPEDEGNTTVRTWGHCIVRVVAGGNNWAAVLQVVQIK
jgi:hypothetical protein